MMDKEPEELLLLVEWDILRVAFNVLRSTLKQFVTITFTLILPLSFDILGHTLFSDLLMRKIEEKFAKQVDGPDANRTMNAQSSEWTKLLFFQAGYFVFLFAFSLLSTAAVVYTVACIYTGKQTSYTKVMSVVPKVWKRLMFTFMWYFLIMVAYNTAFVTALVFINMTVGTTGNNLVFGVCITVVVAVFLVVHVYISALWHLGSVISVLEDVYGVAAIQKSSDLMKGKRIIAFDMLFLYFWLCIAINGLFRRTVVHFHCGFLWRGIWGIILVGLLVCVNLMGLLVQSVFYYVCKSYHHQSIDKSALSEYLEEYLGDYVSLKSSIQMEDLDI